tara:strand:- start:1485 stop:3782 length:2298 start_codon:yes stop_codon:yes gene_type:complete
MAEQKILISIQVKTGKSNQQIKATTKSLGQLATTQKKVSTGNNDMRATAGLNNAILMETSRLASDASFGFTAIANNLSQLVNLFKASKDATGSYSQSIKSLLNIQSALLIGFQLLITFGDDLYRVILKAAGGGNLLKQTFKDASSTVEDSAGKFETYIRTLQDSTKSQDEQNDAIQSLKKEFPDYLNQLDEAGVSLDDVAKNTAEAARQNDIYRDSITKLSMARAAQNMIDELTAERVQLLVERRRKLFEQGLDDDDYVKARMELDKIRIEQSDELAAAREKEAEVNAMLANATEKTMGTAIRMAKEFGETEAGQLIEKENRLSRIVDINQNEINSIDKKIQELIKFTDIEISESKRGAGGRNRAYKEGDLDFEKERQQSQEREIESFLQKETAKVNAEFQGIRDRARIKQEEFVEDEKRRLDAFLRRTKDEDARADAIKRSDEAVQKSKDELSSYIVRLNTEQAAKITKVELEATRRTIELDQKKTDVLASHQDKLDFAAGQYQFNEIDRNIQRLNSEISLQESLNQIHAEGTEERAQGELELAKLKAQLTDEEQNREMERFDFFKDQYVAVSDALSQTFEVTAHNQTVALEERYGREIAAAEGNKERQEQLEQELAKKKDDIQRKQFKIDKAMKIGRALMDTYESGIAAFGSQLIVGDPSSPVRARIAQAVALATGLANVANIARQKYQSSLGAGGGGTGGASGGGLQIQAPDFNVVGASQTSQLAQAVTTQQEKPVKAFVVGKDISTQQELDRNITNTASFG